jgi:NADPH-dependent ferric siderophore reductase
LTAPPAVEIIWIDREDHGVVPDPRAFKALQVLDKLDASGYGFVVGESKLATEGRRHLHRIGLPKDRITFSGSGKH